MATPGTDFPPYSTTRSQLIDQITVALETPMTDRDAQIKNLARRLEDGWARIEEAEASGNPASRKWEDFWLRLAHEYCALVDEAETQAEAAEQAALL